MPSIVEKKGFTKSILTLGALVVGANTGELNQTKKLSQELKEEKKRSSEIERDLRIKEKALAEAVALLLLRKKAQAIWGTQGTNDSTIRSQTCREIYP